MVKRTLLSVAGAVGLAAFVVMPLAAQSQAPAKKAVSPAAPAGAKKFIAKRLPWGDPDISGNYTTKDEANTPMERPERFAGKRIEDITPQELEKENEARRRQALAAAPYPGGGSQSRGVAIAVPIHWFDSLDTNNARPWFVMDPPDGRIPPMTDAAKKRQQDRIAARRARGTADSYTDRSAGDRCISFAIGATRILPTLYGNSVQIIQTKDYVAIRYEMVHETRIIPIEGRAAARQHISDTLRSYYGDSVARWDGDTLIVDGKNYNGRLNVPGGLGTENVHTVERFRKVAPNKVEYSVTLEDPTTWSRAWTFGMPWTEDDTQGIFEYACHEGNYGLRNILSAARSDDKKGIKSSDSVDAQDDLKDFVD
jgi:hypothetical protein